MQLRVFEHFDGCYLYLDWFVQLQIDKRRFIKRWAKCFWFYFAKIKLKFESFKEWMSVGSSQEVESGVNLSSEYVRVVSVGNLFQNWELDYSNLGTNDFLLLLLVSCMEELLQEEPLGNLTILMSKHLYNSIVCFHLKDVVGYF